MKYCSSRFTLSYGIIYKRIYGDLKQNDVWERLDEFLLQKFCKADGTELRILAACMDSGGHFPNKAYKFCKERQVMKYKGGRPYFVWELHGETKRNEPLDCRNYVQAAVEITGVTLARYGNR